jgi:predicted transcriptional regulator
MIDKQHVHRLIEQLDATQLALSRLLEVMLDPISASLANAPFEDEPISVEESAALDEAHAAIQRGEGVPHEEILREFGLR